MELASVLAGEPWSDHAASVHPVLAAVTRVINDRVGEQNLARLEHLVPAMIGTATADIDGDARLVLLCATAALNSARVRSHPDIRAEVEAARRMAQRAVHVTSSPADGRRTGWPAVRLLASSPLARRWYRRAAVWQAVLSVAALAGPAPSDRVALCELLESCVLALRSEPAVASTATRQLAR